VKRIILCGITPGPLDRFNRERKDFVKVSLGAEKSVQWSRVETEQNAVHDFKSQNLQGKVIALEQHEKSLPYTTPVNTETVAIILGSERHGMPAETLALADSIYEIPQYGSKESLNVAVAAGVVVYAIRASSQ
jgi:tRNA G18 (ribose-2'-O)-methylase SpoU